jgi:hypothetical protein
MTPTDVLQGPRRYAALHRGTDLRVRDEVKFWAVAAPGLSASGENVPDLMAQGYAEMAAEAAALAESSLAATAETLPAGDDWRG